MMNCFIFSLLLGSLFLLGDSDFPPGSCDGYKNVSEPWRNVEYFETGIPGYPFKDSGLIEKWWRFTGVGGDTIMATCYPRKNIFLSISYPLKESEIQIVKSAYGDNPVCDYEGFEVSVLHCPGGFYIYKPLGDTEKSVIFDTYHSVCYPDVCGPNAYCVGNGGCHCSWGYRMSPDILPSPDAYPCIDIDECETEPDLCGSNSTCENIQGTFICTCVNGYEATDPSSPAGPSNLCIDINECDDSICGNGGICTNSPGNFSCSCYAGFQLEPEAAPLCQDIDECSETPGICGRETVCTNVPGTFYCSCPDGFYPSTGILWTVGVSFCRPLQEILDEIQPREDQTKGRTFLDIMEQQLKENEGITLPMQRVTNCFSASMEVSGVGPRAITRVGSEGDRETGSVILRLSELLVSAALAQSPNNIRTSVTTPTVDLTLITVRAEGNNAQSSTLSAKGNAMEINMEALAQNNNGTAAAAFLTLNGMETLLSNSYFKSENQTEMYSDVITAILPLNNTNITQPVNFTIHHKKVPDDGLVSCVYWEDKTEQTGAGRGSAAEGEMMRWSVEGCWVADIGENFTVCSCSHLSTFALIMQIGEPPPENPFLEWLNRLCVIIGLVFFGLAIFTFLLCSWNPKINNTARLHLCLNLGMSHLLLLFNDSYTEHELACSVMAGLLHFLVIASFVWMQLEALQLFLLVRRLTKVQVIQKDGLPKPLLYLVGYGVPFVIVGVSALVYSDGYGATEAEVCWLSKKKNFNWALTGPVIAILALNWVLFCATLWSLRPTLANMRSDVSQSSDTRLIVFKILAQFVILGCTWVLGLYQTNMFFQVLFIILNSQQGTFLFIVHCLLNKEVREEYIKWLKCALSKNTEGGPVRDVPSVSEDLDKAEDAKG